MMKNAIYHIDEEVPGDGSAPVKTFDQGNRNDIFSHNREEDIRFVKAFLVVANFPASNMLHHQGGSDERVSILSLSSP